MKENSAKTPKTVDFYGRDFLVSPDVLIPRPETEQMIDMVLSLSGRAYLPGMIEPPRVLPEKPVILDVGTGSGCIAVTVALEIPEAEVFALDISPEALAVAQKNARRLGAKVKFMQSDLLSSYDGPEPDVILANLPYVDKDWEWVDTEALSAEPSIALYAGDGGLELVKKLLSAWCSGSFCGGAQVTTELERRDPVKTGVANASLKKSTQLILELDPCQHQRMDRYARLHGFRPVETRGFIKRYDFRCIRQGSK